jgi:predicted flap endonuclease-1-like 5' DNA nuclease
MNSTEPLFQGAPIWLTLPFAAIAAGVVFALLILIVGARLASRRRKAREEIEEYNHDYLEETPPSRPITPPVAQPVPPAPEPVAAPESVAPPPPAPEPVAEAPAPVAEPEPVAEVPAPVVEPEPVAEAPAPVAEPEPVAEIVPTPPPPVIEEEAPAPEPLADEPIAAAAPLDASPATLASDIAEPAPAPAPEPAPAPAPAPASAADDLTRMKGVGPRLGEKLNSVGITSFAQLAALTPEEAEALDAKLGDFQGRIHRDRWIEQASFLAKNDIAGFEGVFGKL